MRRSDKEITDRQSIEDILNKADVIRLAMVDEGEPYLAALNFAYLDGNIYVHSAKEGRKIDVLKKNNKVAFQADIDAEVVLREDACSCTTRYRSVFGTGRALLLDNSYEKIKALDAIMIKHAGKANSAYPEKALEAVLVIKVEIDSMTGKKSGY